MSHALLSPSSASRWINCPPSALLNAEAGDRDTVFTREGTLAHAVAELKARKHFIGMGPQKYGAALKKLKIGYRRGKKAGTKYLAYADKSDGCNLDEFGRPGFWEKYDDANTIIRRCTGPISVGATPTMFSQATECSGIAFRGYQRLKLVKLSHGRQMPARRTYSIVIQAIIIVGKIHCHFNLAKSIIKKILLVDYAV